MRLRSLINLRQTSERAQNTCNVRTSLTTANRLIHTHFNNANAPDHQTAVNSSSITSLTACETPQSSAHDFYSSSFHVLAFFLLSFNALFRIRF